MPRPATTVLFLLEVFFHLFRLAQQERHVLLRVGHERFQDMGGLLELLQEAIMLLIAPGVPQPEHLPVQGGHAVAQLLAERLEVVSETADFRGIDNCLSHAGLEFVARDTTTRWRHVTFPRSILILAAGAFPFKENYPYIE